MTAYHHVVLRLRMSGAIPSLHHVVMEFTGLYIYVCNGWAIDIVGSIL